MSARIHLSRSMLSLLMLVVFAAFAPLHSGQPLASSVPPALNAQDRSADPSADLSLSGEAEEGQAKLLLRLTVSNAGPYAAEELNLVVYSYDQILTFLEADAPGWTCAGTVGGAACTRPSLAAGESSEVVLRFLVTPPPDPDSSFSLIWVYLSAATPDPTPNPRLTSGYSFQENIRLTIYHSGIANRW